MKKYLVLFLILTSNLAIAQTPSNADIKKAFDICMTHLDHIGALRKRIWKDGWEKCDAVVDTWAKLEAERRKNEAESEEAKHVDSVLDKLKKK